MEGTVLELVQAGIAVELLVPSVRDGVDAVGIRLRTFGKQLPAKRMVLGAGETFELALEEACDKAKDGRWERLDWAARPWPVVDRGDLNVVASWGLV